MSCASFMFSSMAPDATARGLDADAVALTLALAVARSPRRKLSCTPALRAPVQALRTRA